MACPGELKRILQGPTEPSSAFFQRSFRSLSATARSVDKGVRSHAFG